MLCWEEKVDGAHILCRFPVLELRDTGYMFLESKDLNKVRMNSLRSLAINAGHGLKNWL